MSGLFKHLYFIFSTNFKTNINLNYGTKIEDIKSLFTQRSKRMITPTDKNITIRSLVLSKLNYLFLRLPNPSIIKTIQTNCFKLLWNGRPDKIKRRVISKNYDNGGIRMINLEIFVTSLKLTRIRRL